MSNPEDDWAAFEATGGADEGENADDGFGDFGDFGDFPDEEAKEDTTATNSPKAEASKPNEQAKDESLDDIDKELQDFMDESDSFSVEKQSKSGVSNGKDSFVASSTANDKELEDFINEDSVDNVKMVFSPDGTPEQKEANGHAEPQKKIERFDEEQEQESHGEDQVKAKAQFEVLHVERQGEALKVRAVEHAIKGVPAELKDEKVLPSQQEASVKADDHDDGFANFDTQEQPKESKETFDDNAFGNFEEHNQENAQGEQSDGFGDFGHFDNDDSKHSEAEDGFGDFGHFDDKPKEEEPKENEEQQVESEVRASDISQGITARAQPEQIIEKDHKEATLPKEKSMEHQEDDKEQEDFGNFDPEEQEEADKKNEDNIRLTITNKQDGVIEVEKKDHIEGAQAKEEDEFGNFGDFGDAEEQTSQADGGFGDFGDDVDAEPHAETENTGFGNFDEVQADDQQAKTQIQTAQENSSAPKILEPSQEEKLKASVQIEDNYIQANSEKKSQSWEEVQSNNSKKSEKAAYANDAEQDADNEAETEDLKQYQKTEENKIDETEEEMANSKFYQYRQGRFPDTEEEADNMNQQQLQHYNIRQGVASQKLLEKKEKMDEQLQFQNSDLTYHLPEDKQLPINSDIIDLHPAPYLSDQQSADPTFVAEDGQDQTNTSAEQQAEPSAPGNSDDKAFLFVPDISFFKNKQKALNQPTTLDDKFDSADSWSEPQNMFSGDKNQGCRGEDDHYGNIGEDSPEKPKEHKQKRYIEEFGQQQAIDIIDQEKPAEEDGADGDQPNQNADLYFGNFGGFSVGPEQHEANEQHQEENDDAFGNFEGDVEPENEDDGGWDAEFTEAPQPAELAKQETEGTVVDQKVKTSIEERLPESNENDQEEFGNFAEANDAIEDKEEEDDFGDFGDFDEAKPEEHEHIQETENQNSDQTHEKVEEQVPVKDATEPTNQETKAPETEDQEDEFGDFGEFDEFEEEQPAAKNEEDDDFGDFDDQQADAQEAPSPSISTSQNPVKNPQKLNTLNDLFPTKDHLLNYIDTNIANLNLTATPPTKDLQPSPEGAISYQPQLVLTDLDDLENDQSPQQVTQQDDVFSLITNQLANKQNALRDQGKHKAITSVKEEQHDQEGFGDLLDFDMMAAEPSQPPAPPVVQMNEETNFLNADQVDQGATGQLVRNLRLKLVNSEVDQHNQISRFRDSILQVLVSDQNLSNFKKSKIRNEIKLEIESQIQISDTAPALEKIRSTDSQDIDFVAQMQHQQEEAKRQHKANRKDEEIEEAQPSQFMNDLLDMNFNNDAADPGSPSKAPEPSTQPDMLANAFAQFGINLDEEPAEQKEKEPENEMSIPLPDFNTVDHKVKRILDMIPDYQYIFEM